MAIRGKLTAIEHVVNERGCFICVSHKSLTRGYPQVTRGGKRQTIVKYLWEQQNGVVSDGLWLLHECDNKLCINLEHVHLGTVADNNREMHERNRYPLGERHANCKLLDVDVIFIREHIEEFTPRQLANRFKVDIHHIYYIRDNKRRRI